MTEEEFRKEYMGMWISDKEVIEYLEIKNTELNRDKTKLEKQIEKMKCCENCRYFAGFDFTCNVIRATKYGATKDKNGEDCINYDKWELANDRRKKTVL